MRKNAVVFESAMARRRRKMKKWILAAGGVVLGLAVLAGAAIALWWQAPDLMRPYVIATGLSAYIKDPLVEETERLLDELALAPGPVDGKLDARTINAIEDYQHMAGRPVTGEPSPELLQELREITDQP